MSDCRTCRHNPYLDLSECGFFDCVHPITLAKAVKPEKWDPAMVDWRTADVDMSKIEQFANCPTYEPAHDPRTA